MEYNEGMRDRFFARNSHFLYWADRTAAMYEECVRICTACVYIMRMRSVRAYVLHLCMLCVCAFIYHNRVCNAYEECMHVWTSCVHVTATVVEGLESMTSNPVTSLAWVRSPGDTLVVYREGRKSSTGVTLQERRLGNHPPI
jgi:hypothetical protein